MYTGAPRLGSARQECYFCMSGACCVVLRCGKTAHISICEDAGRGLKKIELHEGEIMFVSQNLL